MQGDVSRLADLDRLYRTVKDEKGRIDVLFANAGLGEFLPLGQITEAHFDKSFGINVKGTLFTVQKALPLMPAGGSIILTGSIAGSKGSPGFSVYSATKAAIRNLARSWILDLKDTGIRVNVLSPGATSTPGLHGLAPDAEQDRQPTDLWLPRRRSDGSAAPRRSPRPRSSWRPTRAASSTVPSSSSTAAWRRPERAGSDVPTYCKDEHPMNVPATRHDPAPHPLTSAIPVTHHRTATVDGVSIFYREAGPPDAPVVLLLHGFPTSSHMFRNLIPALADRYRVIAPDYPGFGQSDMPDRATFAYTFDHFAELVDGLLDQLGVARYAMYVMDYGAPVGWRLALKHPERVTALIVQNGNAYEEGLKEFWDPIKAYWADGSDAHRKALHGWSRRRPRSSSTPTASPT